MRIVMAYNKKADENYRKKIDRMAIKYSIAEQAESERLRAYLKVTGKSANSYIKGLIKHDLDSKGIPYIDNTDSTDNKQIWINIEKLMGKFYI